MDATANRRAGGGETPENSQNRHVTAEGHPHSTVFADNLDLDWDQICGSGLGQFLSQPVERIDGFSHESLVFHCEQILLTRGGSTLDCHHMLQDALYPEDYAANRIGAPVLLEPLCEQFGMALNGCRAGGARSIATYSRAFSRYGSFTARDWRSLARLAYGLCGYLDNSASQDQTVGCQTMIRHAHKYLGLSWGTAAQRIGWEWVVERALRREGYVEKSTESNQVMHCRWCGACRSNNSAY